MSLFKDLPQQQYSTIVIDPPWQCGMVTGYTDTRHKRPKQLTYNTLTVEEIKSFPMQQLAAPGAHVYLWTINRYLRAAFDVLDAWQLRFHLCMPMVKKSGIVGANGYVFAAEYCLLAFNGKPMQKFTGIGKLNWLQTAPVRGKHSVKPDSFYQLVETMSPAPRLDCFARRTRAGWTTWGDQCA